MQYKAYSRHMTHFLPLLAVLVSARAQRFYCLAVIVIVFSKRSRAGNKRSFRFPFIDAFAINIVLSLSECVCVIACAHLARKQWQFNNLYYAEFYCYCFGIKKTSFLRSFFIQ